ncbi:hypothetical protein JOB18_021265 [Solea senegalensis]|uniref:Uncharacterized protein n=1 Tax=Solea senegalensis TaxID=28829 RepID=A0AAV6T6K1_SOLSE|nr:hypothetical protein JOB18_021265 [Solea senegalensis]
MRTLLLTSALFAGLFGSLVAFAVHVPPSPVPPAPILSFCKTMWLFGSPCAEVSNTIVEQILAFSPLNGCPQCQYTLLSATPTTVIANHTSADGLQSQNLTFSFSPLMIGGCSVTARSVTLGSTLVNGINYCNLYNLLSASGLSSTPGFTDMTRAWACLGYGLTCSDAQVWY